MILFQQERPSPHHGQFKSASDHKSTVSVLRRLLVVSTSLPNITNPTILLDRMSDFLFDITTTTNSTYSRDPIGLFNSSNALRLWPEH